MLILLNPPWVVILLFSHIRLAITISTPSFQSPLARDEASVGAKTPSNYSFSKRDSSSFGSPLHRLYEIGLDEPPVYYSDDYYEQLESDLIPDDLDMAEDIDIIPPTADGADVLVLSSEVASRKKAAPFRHNDASSTFAHVPFFKKLSKIMRKARTYAHKMVSWGVASAFWKLGMLKKRLPGSFHSAQAMDPNWVPHIHSHVSNFSVIQGDMVLPEATVDFRKMEKTRKTLEKLEGKEGQTFQAEMQQPTSITVSPWSLWPDKKVRYYFDNGIEVCSREAFLAGVSLVELDSCVRFEEVGYGDTNALKVTSSAAGCFAVVGYHPSAQLNLGDPGCQLSGVALHEILHVLGVAHEQSRSDRDEHVRVNWEYVKQGTEENFYILSAPYGKPTRWHSVDYVYVQSVDASPYNFASVMHYGHCEFSVGSSRDPDDCQRTMDPLTAEGSSVMGNREYLSEGDKQMIREMYYCSIEYCNDGIQNQGESGVDCGGPCRLQCGDDSSTAVYHMTLGCGVHEDYLIKIATLVVMGLGICFVAVIAFQGARKLLHKPPPPRREIPSHLRKNGYQGYQAYGEDHWNEAYKKPLHGQYSGPRSKAKPARAPAHAKQSAPRGQTQYAHSEQYATWDQSQQAQSQPSGQSNMEPLHIQYGGYGSPSPKAGAKRGVAKVKATPKRVPASNVGYDQTADYMKFQASRQ